MLMHGCILRKQRLIRASAFNLQPSILKKAYRNVNMKCNRIVLKQARQHLNELGMITSKNVKRKASFAAARLRRRP